MKYIFWVAVLFMSRMTDVFAATPSGGAPAIKVTLENPIGATSPTIQAFLVQALSIVASVGFPVIVLAIIYVGFLFVKAQGNPEEIEKAKSAFLWTVVGAVVVLGAWVIATAIGGTISQLRGF
ncbi:MAG: hypothetical protein AAB819_01505 [Patescibacteria group bacterium]